MRLRFFLPLIFAATLQGQSAPIPVTTQSATTSTPATTPVTPVCITLPKGGGKACFTLAPANIPPLTIKIPALAGGANASGMAFNCKGVYTMDATNNLALTGLSCTLKTAIAP